MKVWAAALINYTHTEILLFEPNLPQVSNESHEHHLLIISSVMQITILTSQQVPLQLKHCALRLHSPGCQSCRVPLEEPRHDNALCIPRPPEHSRTPGAKANPQPLLPLALHPPTARYCTGRDRRSHRGRLAQLWQHIFRPPKTKHWISNTAELLQHRPGNQKMETWPWFWPPGTSHPALGMPQHCCYPGQTSGSSYAPRPISTPHLLLLNGPWSWCIICHA